MGGFLGWDFKNGRGDWIRTNDPLFPKQVRYQAALRPDILLAWSGKRDSNSRPSAWEADALPTELFPQAGAHYRWWGSFGPAMYYLSVTEFLSGDYRGAGPQKEGFRSASLSES
jgi:hypothetical protein